jgi:hypothetical protein
MVNKRHVIAASVRGAAHRRHLMPNQDAIKWYSKFSGSSILALSDGHGSQKSFRSERGAKFAVEVAINTIKAFIEKADFNNLILIKHLADEQLPQAIVREWQAAVQSDIDKQPFSKKELDILNGKDSTLAYGATLLSVLMTPNFITYWQLGDGDILTVWENGTTEKPLPKDERLFANETTSLCGKKAWHDFQCRFQPILKAPPKLILLATDGYANSFRHEASFLQIGVDILQLIETEGLNFVREHLKKWLREASERGSGDDISVGLIVSMPYRAGS